MKDTMIVNREVIHMQETEGTIDSPRKKEKVLITGSSSMIGRALVTEISRYNRYIPIEVPHHLYDLTDINVCENLFLKHSPDYVFHLAGFNGNLSFLKEHACEVFINNTMMALNVLSASLFYKAEKVISVIPSCAYAPSEILSEDKFWNGPPHESVEPHGFAKRNLVAYSKLLRQQYGLKAICVGVNNSFGPHDSYDVEKTKVIGGLIKKFVEAKDNDEDYVSCWGSGIAKREFIYCDDVAKGLMKVLKKYDGDFINLGSNQEISIKELAELIKELVGYTGNIRWDTSKPDGQLRKKFDLTKMTEELAFEPGTHFRDALITTINWYQENKASLS